MAIRYRTTPSFKRRLKKKPADEQAAVQACILLLATNPRHPGLRTKRLQLASEQGVFSARIDQANRLTFQWDGDTLVLRNHCSHDAVYRRP